MTYTILSIIFLVIFLGLAGVSIYRSVSLTKTPMVATNFKDFFKKNSYFLAGAIISFILASIFFVIKSEETKDALHMIELVIGGLVFSGALCIAINTFILHYYGRNIPEKLNKWLFRITVIGFTASAFFFFIYTNGLAPYFTYPLVNGISFQDGFVSPNSGGKPNIAFYALCILSGAILVYFLCDHYMYKEYGKHGILESTFFVAFPAGIIGARIWYVIGEWNNTTNGMSFAQRVADGEWWAPLAIWEGGITILGGAVMGIAAGVLWYMWRNKGKNIFLAVDIIVPAILIAQAVGRWGNFFNCEVHGIAVNEDAWRWLPEIIFRNAHFSDTGGTLTNQIYVPLFFIAAIVNLLGYFILAHVFGKALRKYTELGDLAFGYIIWYGLTRTFMEPLRAPNYQMGEQGFWSWVWAMVFVVFGAICIIANHIIRYIIRKKKGEFKVKPSDTKVGLFGSLSILLVGGALLTVAIILLANNEPVLRPVYNSFNAGLMFLVVAVSILLGLAISIPKLIEGLKNKQVKDE
ncbi:MAG: prolipoprotein diacylglyceryl transferase [Bacilli bacterium]|nr:prolipoprotein diacylglyceryl transferase [Bacilli bacterium]